MNDKDNIIKHFFGLPPPPPSIPLESATVIHGENCARFGCTICSSKAEVEKLEEIRRQQYLDSHRGKFKGVRAQRAKKREEKQQQTQQHEQDEDLFSCLKEKQDEPDPREDIEPI